MSDDRLHDLLLAAARRDAVAVVDGDRTTTWSELAADAGRVANLLDDLGVRPGDRVGLWADKGVEVVAGIHGVLLAGGCYVPLDPDAPVARVGRIVRSAGAEVVLVDRHHLTAASALVDTCPDLRRLVVVDGEAPEPLGDVGVVGAAALAAMPAAPPEVADVVSPDDLAYVLYTSGSTGEPKGVMHTHRSALAFVDWAVAEYGVDATDRLSSHAPFHFDLSTFDLFAAARAGARTVLVPKSASVFPMALRRLIEDAGITVWYSVPAILATLSQRAALLPGDLPSLRTVLFAGEVFPTPVLRILMTQLPHATFANLYGPTETNVCTAWTCPRPLPAGDAPIPIGTTIAPDHAIAVDEHGVPVPDGEEGELWVGGGTVMRGYLGDPERTSAGLVPDPRDPTAGPLYRTGDLVRRAADGTWCYLGRRDAQVKVRGHRIELGEVEAALHHHPAVTEAVVLAVPDGAGSNRLVAVVAVDGEEDGAALRRHCAGLLPAAMVPSDVTVLASLPRTSTGKVDRRALIELGAT